VSAAVHDLEGVSRRLGADALVASPFEPVAGKSPALGERGLRALRERAPGTFLVALGGLLDAGSCARALAAGADAVALRRLWLDAPLPETVAAVVIAR
jgi:thiamine monophosphate synthase